MIGHLEHSTEHIVCIYLNVPSAAGSINGTVVRDLLMEQVAICSNIVFYFCQPFCFPGAKFAVFIDIWEDVSNSILEYTRMY